ncbi:M13 family metallopeptidase [Marisediminicola antarctica]|uniref:Peptidase M13 n=1 Tax=Marisediminicola antarctica TaxID=674079 RepID=A0A7L5AJR4_9MICO|nr:M13-type metalloendopeptidase [Marisediminicola antarctica]QHO68529.1 peptidase M13 [Marisediminicola antarctica]
MSAENPLSSGIDTSELDSVVRPQDDLFRHVNGKWITRTEIPSDKARYGSFYVLAEAAEKAVQDIIIEAQSAEPATEERKFGDLYASFMDEARVNELGADPLRPLLAEVAAVTDIDSLLGTLGRLERKGTSGFLQLFVDNDPGRPDRYLVFVEQGGLGLPDESYYREESFAAVRAKYREFVETMFTLAAPADERTGTDAAERAARVVDLETAIAAAHWDNVRTRDSEATYNPMQWSAAATLAVGIDLNTWLDGVDAPSGALAEVVVREPSFVESVAALLTPDRLEAWTDWLAWQVIRSNAAYLSDPFVAANFDFYGRTLTGTPEMRARWKRGVSLVEGSLGEAVGRTYVARHFPATAKASMDVLVEHLIEAYRQSISSLAWMTEDTRGRALEKLEKFTPKIGFPSKWRDYSGLEIEASDLLGNVRATNEFEFQRELGKIGKPLDRDEWFMTPQTINAYYNPGFNEIVFPAAILQYPFFDETRDAAANYGAIGAVIGHEIGHGFDDQGSKYDGDGLLTDWWTEADRAAFEKLTASLIGQYNVLAPAQVPDNHVNGALTIGENIGDLGGLGIAWKAYLLSLGGETPPVIDGMSGAQRFFISWAQAWQMKARDEEVVRLLTIDPHSPNEFRCNQIVRNIDEFYETFGLGESDELWLAPDERVTIW